MRPLRLQPIETRSAAGKALLDMLGVFAEFETNLRMECQMEGIANTKAEGGHAGKGMKPTISTAKVKEMAEEG